MTERRAVILLSLKRWGVLLGITFVTLVIVLIPFMARGHYLVWRGDGANQHALFISYMRDNGMFGFYGYDYKMGLGCDYTQAFTYYSIFDPLILLVYVMPHLDILMAYSIIVCVKFVLCSVFMYIYLRSKKVKEEACISLAVAYMLSGYVLYTFSRHPDLCAGAMYLPLVMLGIDKSIQKKPPFVLIGSVFVMTISSFYTAYMTTIYAVIYAALQFVHTEKQEERKITAKSFFIAAGRVGGWYATGLLLSSFVLLPVAYTYLNGVRAGNKGLKWYDFTALYHIIRGFFAPKISEHYTAIMFNIVTLLLIFAAFGTPKKSAYGKLTAGFAAAMFVPIAGYVMNLFNYPNNRFSFLLSFSAFALIGVQLGGEHGEFTAREVNFAIRGTAIMLALLANFGLWAGIYVMAGSSPVYAIVLTSVAAAALFFGCVFGLHKLCKREFLFEFVRKKVTAKRAFCALFIVDLVFALAYNVTFSAEFDTGAMFYSQTSHAERYVAAQQNSEKEFTRLDRLLYYDKAFTNNRPLFSGYVGTAQYNTMAPAAIGDFIETNNILITPSTLGLSGVNGRTALQALLCTKYYMEEHTPYVPAQFSPSEVEGLYVTDKYIPFGTVFPSMSEADFNALPDIEKQYAALSAVAVKGGASVRHTNLSRIATSNAPERIKLKKGESAKIKFSAPDNCEIYIEFGIDRLLDEGIALITEHSEHNIYSPGRGDQMYTGKKHFLVKIDSMAEVELRNNCTHAVTIEQPRIYYTPNADIIERIEGAKQLPHLKDTSFTSGGFTGSINSSGGNIFIPLLYSGGWKAYVDGSEVEIKVADGAFMTVFVESGEHKVEFVYDTPWKTPGIALTLVGVAVTLAPAVYMLVVFVRSRQKREKAEKDEPAEE